MGRLGLIASFQPTHGESRLRFSRRELPHPRRHLSLALADKFTRGLTATSDMGYAESRLGPERIKGAYAWRSLIKYVFLNPPPMAAS